MLSVFLGRQTTITCQLWIIYIVNRSWKACYVTL